MRSYMASYYTSAFQNVLKKHQLIVDRAFPRYTSKLTLTPEHQGRWLDLFGASDDARHAPFSYHSQVGTMLLMKVVEDVGVNFRHLLHLQTRMAVDPSRRMEAGRTYEVGVKLDDIVPMGRDRVVLAVGTRVRRPDGSVLATYTDHFIILHLEPEYLELMREGPQNRRREPLDHLRGLSKRRPVLRDELGDRVREISIDVPSDMGMRYGRVSGDLNLIHTTSLAARIFGYGKPFIQGLCSVNYTVKALTEALPGHIESLTARFCRRVNCGDSIRILHADGRFEMVCANRNELHVVGEYTRTA